ncbi:hypothetical protein MLD38_018562 [Melastoma candidum]|uniref:Uncharacterized protein n=1 Tax=Melastoma candidum TaxID=119954 RepID=A0ACB9QY95_9MYRT|nr:hypothetical protein MLD38_018562 [Melastoma candidum]
MSRKTVLAFDILLLCLLTILCRSSSLHHHHHRRHRHHHRHETRTYTAFQPTKLFVFGDSYADTGNTLKESSTAWKVPYGETFPGKPSGRFSDGRVLSDFVANYFGLISPIPYNFWKDGESYLKYGMNFAVGGTGVFETLVPLPNMTVQIDMFIQLIDEGVYSKTDLQSSVALVTLSGNDYNAYLHRNGSVEGLPALITEAVAQLTVNIERIHNLGMKKVAVAGLQPLGCLPLMTYPDAFQRCNHTINDLVVFHNQLLSATVATLNAVAKDSSTFVLVDLYDSFLSVINGTGSTAFANPLQPCCIGIDASHSCGDIDSTGAKLYELCADQAAMFFWDLFHPTQQGWKAVYNLLESTLQKL